MKARRPMRADRVPRSMNASKADNLLDFVPDLCAVACGVGQVQ